MYRNLADEDLFASEGHTVGANPLGGDTARNESGSIGLLLDLGMRAGDGVGKGKVLARRAVAAGRTSATLTGLASGKAYYVKVRPLREVSGTTYVGVQRYCKATAKAR